MLNIKLGNNVVEIADLKEAQAALLAYRDMDAAFGPRGSRDFKKNDGLVKKGKVKVAEVSYNGRVLDMERKEIIV